MQFTSSDIEGATHNFADRLGMGGFSEVFKGFINGSYIAIKRLTEVIIIKICITINFLTYNHVAVAMARRSGQTIPMKGQLQTEIQALTKYLNHYKL